MPRRPPKPGSELGHAIQQRRLALGQLQEHAAAEVKIAGATLSRIERGLHVPAADTARELARWLGDPWTTDSVRDAARKPAPADDGSTLGE